MGGVWVERVAWICLGLLLLQSCAAPPSKPDTPAVPAQTQSRLPAEPSVRDFTTYADTSRFDSELSDSLDKNPADLKIVPREAISTNEIPPRLEKWFSAVVTSGGKVRLQKVPPAGSPATRGTFVLGEVLDLVFTVYEYIHEAVLYAPAKKYDVVVAYSGSEIQTITFKQRAQKP